MLQKCYSVMSGCSVCDFLTWLMISISLVQYSLAFTDTCFHHPPTPISSQIYKWVYLCDQPPKVSSNHKILTGIWMLKLVSVKLYIMNIFFKLCAIKVLKVWEKKFRWFMFSFFNLMFCRNLGCGWQSIVGWAGQNRYTFLLIS